MAIETSPSTSAQVTLDPAPPDAVSRVSFSPTARHLLVATWAGTLTVHHAATGLLHAESKPHSSALLDAAWAPSGDVLLSAGLDGSVAQARLAEAAVTERAELGRHSAGARALAAVPAHRHAAVSAGWDARLRVWDLREGGSVADADLGDKAHALAPCGEHAVIAATAARRVRVVDLRRPDEALHDRAPPTLTYQLRGLSAAPDGSWYAVGGTEGRVAVDSLDGAEHSPFSFRCHRLDGLAFPVNCIAHNQRFASFATGGGDGHVSFWDGQARKRIAQFARYPTSIASIDFSDDSTSLAVAVSYTFEEGEKDHPPDEVHIRSIDESYIATKQSKESEQDNNNEKQP